MILQSVCNAPDSWANSVPFLIPHSYSSLLIPHLQDGTDEESCGIGGHPACPEFMFQCGDGSCLEVEKVCDGVLDCRDKRDEKLPTCGWWSYNADNSIDIIFAFSYQRKSIFIWWIDNIYLSRYAYRPDPSAQTLMTRKRMRNLYNGFEAYGNKVQSVLEHLEGIRRDYLDGIQSGAVENEVWSNHRIISGWKFEFLNVTILSESMWMTS